MSARCRSCGAPIIWATTVDGRAMPVNVQRAGDTDANLVLRQDAEKLVVEVVAPGRGTHRPHFATCPNAAQHRRGGGSTRGR